MKLKSPTAYWSSLDEKRRSAYRIVAVVLLGLFALFTALAVCSYFLTWKQDASLLSDPAMMDAGTAAGNAGSKLGFRWGHFLVTRSFGLAALGVVASSWPGRSAGPFRSGTSRSGNGSWRH